MDLNEVEHVRIATAGGADNIVINDLTGIGITQVAIDLASGRHVASRQLSRSRHGQWHNGQ